MIKTEVINPNVSNFIKSLRDVGYTFEVAVADVLDNSITAKASNVKIYTVNAPKIIFCMLDNGEGMGEKELVEAMRLASKNPEDERSISDLGRFGLGLKTASFSQCKNLTVLSKKNGTLSVRQWDLDYISAKNEWLLIKPEFKEIDGLPLVEELKNQESGTLVIWQNIDRYSKDNFTDQIYKLRKHLSLVFHRFLENNFNKLKISVNENILKPFNPFNIDHPSTQQIATEKVKLYDSTIDIEPFILPHHSRVSQQEYEQHATEEGYIKSQGFYLYRANRLLIHGTWWGLHKVTDAHKLVRIRISIPNNQDKYWGIDIKKSTASPVKELKKDLKIIIQNITEKGSRPYTGRGRRIKDKTIIKFWDLIPQNEVLHFGISKDHPLYKKLYYEIPEELQEMLKMYLKGLEAYLPLEAIQAQLQQNPHQVKQKSVLDEEEVKFLIDRLIKSDLDKDFVASLIKAELFKEYRGIIEHE